MHFSLRVICNRSIVEDVNLRIKALTEHLSLSDSPEFSAYWKDEICMILEIHADIQRPDYSKIRQYIREICGTDTLSEHISPNDWECAYFAPFSALQANEDTAFVVCNIF